MSKSWCVALVAVALVTVLGCAAAYERASVDASVSGPGASTDVSYFYGELSPYGRWVDCGSRGWCWTPYDVSADWRPYSEGHWAYTDLGSAWVSDEPWGWACYHYGRWMPHPDYGWVATLADSRSWTPRATGA